MAPDVPPPKTAWTSFILGLVFIYFFIRLSPLSHYVRRLALLRRNAPRVTSPQVRLREDHPDYPMQCMALITSLLVRAHMITEAHVYDEMITMARKALALSPEQTDQRRFACLVLSGTLYARNTLTGEDPLLVEAIELAREAFSSSPPHNSQFLASRSSTLALYLTARYEGTGDDHLLDEAMDLQREAIALCPANEMNRSRLYRNLANSLNARYNRTGDGVSGDEAVSLQREVLSLCPTGHPDRAQSCQDLAKSLFMRYRGSSNDRLLDETVNLGREALALRRTGGQDWAEFGGNLANYLWARYQISGEVHVLDEVIELQSAVQALRPKGHVYRDASCASLGRSLRTRHQRTGDDRLLDEAVDLHREALALCPVSHVNRRCHCENLAQSLFQIYFIRRSNCLLVEAIELEREALGLCPAEDPSRAITCGDLGAMLMAYYFTTGDGSMLDEAIHLQREAIALCPAGHRSRAMLSINLASTLMKHYNPTSDHSVLDEIFDLISQAMAIAPAHTVWRYHGYLCWLHLQRASTTFYDVDKAITCLSKCFENEPDDVLGLMMQVIFRVEPIWQHDLENHGAELVVVYQRLVNVLPLLANFALDIQPQLRALKNFKNVGSDAFVSAALAGNLRSGIETLEVAQGVVWSQTLRYRNPQLQAVPEPLKSELESLLDSIASSADRRYDGQETEFSQRNVLHLHNSRAYSVIQKIRAISGFERFMLGETYEALCTAASAHPIVVLVGARGHFYALIIAPSQLCEHALLSLHLTEDDMREIFSTPGLAKGHRGASALDNATLEAERGMKKILPTHVESPLHRQLRALWLKVVKPVLDYLNLKSSHAQIRPRLHWCPTGLFSALPIHAAGIYEGPHKVCCADFVVSSYTPTITTLLRAQKASSPLKRSDLALALVAEKRAEDPNLEVIFGVEEEVESVAATVKLSDVNVLHRQIGATTVAGTAAAMQAANVVHLACHGIQDISDATKSGFCLGDGRLTITKLMELKLDNAFLAFLSACETAKGDKDQPDQLMHLAAAMLFTGFKSVVATMWAIVDDDGPKVAKWFYEELFAKEVVDADSVAYAIDFAVGKLRESGVPPHRWAPFIHMGA